jgi:hypothetical protein
MPVRNWLADITTSNWINQRFRDKKDDPPYLQGQFLAGAKTAVRRFFQLLQEDIQKPVSNEEIPSSEISLQDIVKRNLYQEIRYHHEQFHHLALQLEFRLNSLSNFRRGDNWMEFGPASRVNSTLQKGQIHTELAPHVFWRYDPETKKWLFREVTFEYDISPKDVDLSEEELEPPPLQKRAELTRMGAVVGIDVIADIDATLIVKDPSDESKQWIETMRRPISFRFETTHFSGKYEGGWKIADIDNFFASKLLE